MSRVLVVVEGQTENVIIEKVLAPYLALKGVYIHPRIIGKPGHKGGNKFQTALKDITMLVKQEPASIITTFFTIMGYLQIGREFCKQLITVTWPKDPDWLKIA